MANTFAQIHLHIVFAVKYRETMLADEWRDELFRYIGGVIKNNGQTPVIVGGYRDHVHILIGCNTRVDIPAIVKDIKLSTHHWIQSKHKCLFAWQDGYGVFSISKSHEKALIQYIKDQPNHHTAVSMTDEFKRLLSVNGIEYQEAYLPHEPI